jgi:hypothetical protein
MFMPNHGDKSEVPFLMFGRQNQVESKEASGETPKPSIFKKVKSWRIRRLTFVDITQDKNFIEDVLVEILKQMTSDQSIRI